METKTNKAQFKSMLDYMESHPDLAKNFLNSNDGKTRGRSLWNNLVERLNSVGPPIKDLESWKRVWYDLKNSAKTKSRKNYVERNKTGGGPPNILRLSDIEERVMNLLAASSSIEGIPNARAFGVPQTQPSQTRRNLEIEDEFEVEYLEDEIPEQPPAKRPRRNAGVDNEMRDFMSNSVRIFNKIVSTLQETKEELKSIKILLSDKFEFEKNYKTEKLNLLKKNNELLEKISSK